MQEKLCAETAVIFDSGFPTLKWNVVLDSVQELFLDGG